MDKKWRVVLVAGFIVVISFFFYWFYFEQQKYHFRVIFFDIGQGDSALINFSNGERALIDCGPNSKILSKLGGVLPFYNRTIDYLIVTHPDLDHYGGCLDVLKRYQVRNIIENGESKISDNYWNEWSRLAGLEGAKHLSVGQDFNLSFGREELFFFYPLVSSSSDWFTGNNRSIVFKLLSPDFSVMFTGDAEYDLEKTLLEKYSSRQLQSGYLKIGHHGSDSSTSDEWLDVVKPDVGIMSVGKNKFGHPSLRVLRKLLRIGAVSWRTDEKGDIILRNKH